MAVQVSTQVGMLWRITEFPANFAALGILPVGSVCAVIILIALVLSTLAVAAWVSPANERLVSLYRGLEAFGERRIAVVIAVLFLLVAVYLWLRGAIYRLPALQIASLAALLYLAPPSRWPSERRAAIVPAVFFLPAVLYLLFRTEAYAYQLLALQIVLLAALLYRIVPLPWQPRLTLYLALAMLSALVVFALHALLPEARPRLIPFVGKEGFVEDITAEIYALAFLTTLVSILLGRQGRDRRPYLAIPLLCLFALLEEVSYFNHMPRRSLPSAWGIKIDSLHDILAVLRSMAALLPDRSPLWAVIAGLLTAVIVLLLCALNKSKGLGPIAEFFQKYPPYRYVLIGICLGLIAATLDLYHDILFPVSGYAAEEMLELGMALGMLFAAFSIVRPARRPPLPSAQDSGLPPASS
jgi:hypothetical protein